MNFPLRFPGSNGTNWLLTARRCLWVFFLIAGAGSAAAQLGGGTGWNACPVAFKVQWPTNAARGERYWFTNDIYHCETFSNDGAFEVGNHTKPRTEQRFEPDYRDADIQYQSMEMVPANENSFCVFQIHTGNAETPAHGATTFMLFWFADDGGSLRIYNRTEVAGNLANKWFQLNVEHNVPARTIRVWINKTLVWTQKDNGAGDFYFKDGVYVQGHRPTHRMDTYIGHIRIWTKSLTGATQTSRAN